MEFRILGPLFADPGTSDGPVVIRQPLLQAALGVLLLRANRPCPRDWLVDALWGNEPPSSPEASLRVCMSRLRRDLGDCAIRLETLGPAGGRTPGHRLQRGYRMRVRPGELDLDEFSDLVGQGRAELDLGNAGAAAGALVQALSLWGDPPLPNLPDTPAIAAETAALKEQHRAAREALIDARMLAGENAQVLAELRAMVLADPGRERTYAQLMRAYHALGMHSEALDVYQIAREAILKELGAEPGPSLAVLHGQILAEDVAMKHPAVAMTESTALTSWRTVWQVPAPPADFAGRADEIEQIATSLASSGGVPITVITGVPGSGKSALAAAAALALREQFPDGQLFAEFGALSVSRAPGREAAPRDHQEVLADLLYSLGMPAASVPPAGPARAAIYRSLLANRKVLLVADAAVTAEQVMPLVPAASGAAVLVTSRNGLIGVPGAKVVTIGPLAEQDALTLLAAVIVGPNLDTDPQSATRIIRACGALPVAIRRAGAAMAARPWLTLAHLASELDSGDSVPVPAERMDLNQAG